MSGISDNPLSSLDVFWTELSPTRGVVYARLTDVECRAGWRLTGTIRGPRSIRHQTLPATVPFQDLGPGPTHLARAVVPDPSYWSPESPNIYDVTIELHRDGEPTLVEQRMLGFRPIRAGERYLQREGKTWIPRGAMIGTLSDLSFDQARELGLVLRHSGTSLLDDSFFEQASSQGIYLAVDLGGDRAKIQRDINEYSRWPAVFMAFIVQLEDPESLASLDRQNLIVVARDERADVVYGSELAATKPTIAVRPIEAPHDLLAARAACDQLQRELAPRGPFAGYFV